VVRPEVVVVVLSINMQGKRRLGSGKVRSPHEREAGFYRAGGGTEGGEAVVQEEEEEEEGLFKADAVNEEDPERDRATQV